MEKNAYELIQDLVSRGMTQSDIASEIGVTQGAISQVLSGHGKRGFRFDSGYRLLQLHARKTKEASHA